MSVSSYDTSLERGRDRLSFGNDKDTHKDKDKKGENFQEEWVHV